MRWTEIAQAIGSIVSGVVGLVGFMVVTYQLIQLKIAVRSETHARLYDQAQQVIGILVSRPELRPYFYDNKSIGPDNELHGIVMTYAEMTADYLEHIAVQKKTLPPEVWEKWVPYIRDRYKSSEVLRNYFSVHSAEYSDELCDALEPPGKTRFRLSESDQASLSPTPEQGS